MQISDAVWNRAWGRPSRSRPGEAVRLAGIRKALEDLLALCTEEDIGVLLKIIGNQFFLPRFTKRWNVKQATGFQGIARLIWGQRPTGNSDLAIERGGMSLPFDDHVSLWLKDDKPFMYTSQPYGLGHEDIRDILNSCEKHGLRVRLGAGSWHHTGETLLVEIMKDGEARAT